MAERIAPRWRKLLRDASLHKARTALVVLAVAVAMIGAGALLDSWALVRRVTQQTYLASHPANATLLVERTPGAALLAQLRALPALAAVRVRGRAMAAVQVGATRHTAELFALDDFSAREIGALALERGAWPRDGEIAIEKSSLDYAGISLDQTLELRRGDAAQRVKVGGVAHDVGLPPGWMDHVVYGYVTPATLAALGVEPARNELQFVLRDARADRNAVRRVAADVKALLERNGIAVRDVEVPEPGQHPHAAQMDSLMLTQGAFGALTLLVASFLIVNLFAAMLAAQAREIGVMKALGARPRQIATLYLVYAAALGLLASLLALPAALAIARPYAAMKADMLNFSIEGFAVPWWAFALQLAVGCLLPVLAAALPVRRACRLPVAATLRDAGIAAAHGSHLPRRIALPGLSRPLALSLGNAFRRRQRMVLTLLALAAGGAVYLGAANLRRSVVDSVDAMFAGQHYDVVLSFAAPHPATELQQAASAVDGVAGTQALLRERAVIVHADGTRSDAVTLVGLPPDTPLFHATIEQGRWLDAHDDHALVIGERLAREEPQLRVGGDAVFEIGGTRATWHIVGIEQTAFQPLAYAPFATLAAQHGDDRASLLAVATRGGNAATKLDTILRLRAAFEQRDQRIAGSQLLSEMRRSIEDHLLMVEEFLGAMAWVMILVGGMGLASTMSLSVLERTREIGVLRAIGARHGAIARLVQVEGLVIAALAWLVALPLSLPMSGWLAEAFGKVMFPVPVHVLPGAGAALRWLVLVLVVSLAACAWPARRATRVPIARALSYE